jgi:hypothetical protein
MSDISPPPQVEHKKQHKLEKKESKYEKAEIIMRSTDQ